MKRTLYVVGCLLASILLFAIFNAFKLDGFYFLLPLVPVAIFIAIGAWCWVHFVYETKTCGSNCTKCCNQCPCREEISNEIDILNVDYWQGDEQKSCETCQHKNKCNR